MRAPRGARLAALAVAALAVPTGLVVGTAGTASANASCGQAAPADLDGSNWPKMPAGVSANERSGSNTGCGVKGWADNQDQLDYHCYTFGIPADVVGSWTYVRNNSDGSAGWVKDSLLPGYGSIVPCGF
jgi:SH3-like domain-containing protein